VSLKIGEPYFAGQASFQQAVIVARQGVDGELRATMDNMSILSSQITPMVVTAMPGPIFAT
jgi:hypothetical protein